MEFTNRNSNITNLSYVPVGEQTRTRSFIANVFLLMFVALGVSALFAWQFSINTQLLSYLIAPTGLTGLGKITLFAPLGFVLIMSFAYQRLSSTALMALFMAYAITGASSTMVPFLIFSVVKTPRPFPSVFFIYKQFFIMYQAIA